MENAPVSSTPPLVAADVAHAEANCGVIVRDLGRTDYESCWHAMRSFTGMRDARTADEIWLTEHAPVYTLGLAGRREHLIADRGIAVLQVDRGGQVTYHGPGQLVAYLLFDLGRLRLGVRDMVRSIESAVVDFVDSQGIPAYGKPDAPGVYVMRGAVESKLAALGLKVRNGCTYHGLALNVAMDLSPFDAIDPCGYPGLAVTSLAELGVDIDVHTAGAALAPRLAAALTRPRSPR